ncbi:MAG: MEMO1 family protein [Methanotrichaceae archaeon]|nr:MEMO1 family protein [Methanotrichaceae archaeon]
MRFPVVAGQFYSGSADGLRQDMDEAFRGLVPDPTEVIGAVVPHAGYIYSGSVAAEVYSRLPQRDTYVLIGPNHHGQGIPIALSRDTWKTPLGAVECDQEFADALSGSILEHDELAHAYEHSLEVQIPFLQRSFAGFKILPICMGLQDEESAVEVGSAIGEAARRLGRSCTIIASSDFSHYRPQEVARRDDAALIEAILHLDVPELYSRLYSLNVSACGYGPIAATIVASRILGASRAKLLRYATSGDVTGDYRQVVGYAAIVFT